MWAKYNFFQYGELGERITGIRESEIYQNSANEILNFIITEVNTLRVAKKYRSIQITTDKIIKVIDTKYNFFIVITYEEIIVFSRDIQRLSSIKHDLAVDETTNVNIFDNQIYITDKFFSFNELGHIGTSNFKSMDRLQ